MATPLESLDGILPYAIRYKMGSGAYMVAEPNQRASGEFFSPPAGVYQIQLAYTGPEAAEVWWKPAGFGVSTIKMCQIPADASGTPLLACSMPIDCWLRSWFAACHAVSESLTSWPIRPEFSTW